jgi:uncharacterized protein YbjQ (UPF0145 family)
MGGFPKSDKAFFPATVMPKGEGAGIGAFLGVVNGEAVIGEAVIGANIFRDMFSSVRDVVGIDFDDEVLGETNGMMMVSVSVSGTALKLA